MRDRRGAAIVQAVAGLWLLVVGVVLGSLLLLNVGAATYGNEKISFVADQGAMYATTLPAGTSAASRQMQVESLVDQLIQNMGFNSASTTVKIADVTSGSQAAVQVTVTTTMATLLAGNFGTIFPAQITLPCQSTAVKNIWFNGYCQTSLLPIPPVGLALGLPGLISLPGGSSGGQFVNPIVTTNNTFPTDGLPHYKTNIFGTSVSP